VKNNLSGLYEQSILKQEKKWSWEEIRSIKIKECGEKLVPLSLYPERILVRSQYFLQGVEGALAECFARESVLKRLIESSKMLPEGFKLVIFDVWRPVEVQRGLFNKYKEEIKKEMSNKSEITKLALQFVALPSDDPNKPPPHNTGGAADLTIADFEGRYLSMGTEFDETTEKSKTTYYEELFEKGKSLTKEEIEALKNRRLLYNIMTSAGFTNYPEEWWHFDYGNQNWAWVKGESYAIYGKTKPYIRWSD